MIIDALTKFCQDEAASGTVAVRLEGDVIDLGAASRYLADGHPVYVVVVVEAAAASAGSATIKLTVASDAAAAIAVDGSATEHANTAVLAYTAFSLGARFVLPLLPGVLFERYLGLLVTTAGATTTALVISAFLTMDPHAIWRAYAEGDS